MKGQRAHPGAEAIAACMGDVRAWRARRVAAHLAACPSCSALQRQLRQVSVVLAAVPPTPLPGDVAQRLDAALAAEVAARAMSGSALTEAGVPAPVPSGPTAVAPEPVVPAGPGVVPPGPAVPDGQHRHRPPTARRAWRVPRPVPVLAALALCLVLGGGGYLISQSGGTGVVSAGSAAGNTASQAQPRHLSPAVGGQAIVAGPVGVSYEVRSTNTNYLPATLRQQASSEVSSPGASALTPPSIALQACVMKVAGNHAVAFVDLAKYQGRPATVIVAKDHVWVTSRGCNATQHDVLASVSLSGG